MAQAMSAEGKRQGVRMDVVMTCDLLIQAAQAIKAAVVSNGLAEIQTKKQNA